MVLVTHDPAVAALADRVIHLSDGQIEREEVLRPQLSERELASGKWGEKAVAPYSAVRAPR
jgi:ABC-type sulfate/molybdate transport systems ATPase subunit